MKNRKVGIIGSGFMASIHAAAWLSLNVDLTAVLLRCEQSDDSLASVPARRFTDLAAFLDAVDVVDVCTPTHLHAVFARAAAAAGKPTICEKPLVLDSAEGVGLVETFAAAGIPLFVAHVLRFGREYAAIRDVVSVGGIGVPAVVRLSRLSFAPKRAQGSWFADPAKSGGIEFDLMIHDLDYARWIAGEVASVYSKSTSGGDGHAITVLTHRSGAISHVEGSWSNPAPVFREIVEITGSTGVIGFCSDDTAPVTIRLHRGSEEISTGLDE
ncbi:MAG: Gfo/Idh/MocA family oxidoreductase [Actinobacteria bacterium]|jgi:predicted dehydrogenase|nr:Gfo/Idh/MocA family oxidoreductase [Actinomycetota bacterium]